MFEIFGILSIASIFVAIVIVAIDCVYRKQKLLRSHEKWLTDLSKRQTRLERKEL